MIGKAIQLVKPLKPLLYVVVGLVMIGWGGYEAVHRFVTKEDLDEVMEQHSAVPHDPTSAKMRMMQTDIEEIDVGVNELEKKAVRNESVQQLHLIRGKYVEKLSEYNANGRRGKQPPRPPEIDKLEAELLK